MPQPQKDHGSTNQTANRDSTADGLADELRDQLAAVSRREQTMNAEIESLKREVRNLARLASSSRQPAPPGVGDVLVTAGLAAVAVKTWDHREELVEVLDGLLTESDDEASAVTDGDEPAEAVALRDRVRAAAAGHAVHLIRSPAAGDDVLGALSDMPRPESPVAPGTPDRAHAALLGSSLAVRELEGRVREVAATADPVLIVGEAGSGKDGVARAIHEASPRAPGPFVAMHCAAFPTSLLHAELFGHVAGAFTGALRDRAGRAEEASGGTLYLDGVDHLPPDVGGALADVLASGSVRPLGGQMGRAVDVRVIAALDRDGQDCAAALPHPDLAARLAPNTLRVAPLRERPEDVRVAAARLLQDAAGRLGRDAVFTDAAVAALEQHDFPGNLLELENVVEQALAAAEGAEVDAHHLPLVRRGGAIHETRTLAPGLEGAWPTVQQHARDLERALLERALAERADLDLPALARLLGTSTRVLELRMRELGLTEP